MHLGCGLSVGLSGLAAGYCIGIVGDTGVRAYMQQSRIFVGMVLILIFGEVLGLYGYVSHPRARKKIITDIAFQSDCRPASEHEKLKLGSSRHSRR